MNMKKYFNKSLSLLIPEDEKYAPLSQGNCFLQTFTEEGLIFANCDCIAISMLSCLKSKLQVKERDLFDCFGKK